MTFHRTDSQEIAKVDMSDDSILSSSKKYISDSIEKLGYLGTKFLSFDDAVETVAKETEKKVKDSVDRSLRLALTIIGSFGVLLAILYNQDKISNLFGNKQQPVPELIVVKDSNVINRKLVILEKRLQILEKSNKSEKYEK